LGGYASTFYTKAYLRHLKQSNEYLAGMIASVHNLTFYLWLVGEARRQIIQGDFLEWKNKMVKQFMTRL
ncbi:MAG: tRNA guanosine(34) transglycosylase Tgt, partial [Bacteroidota bacterium]